MLTKIFKTDLSAALHCFVKLIGKVALDSVGLHIDAYFASETDEGAMLISQANHGQTICQLGDVTKITRSVVNHPQYFYDIVNFLGLKYVSQHGWLNNTLMPDNCAFFQHTTKQLPEAAQIRFISLFSGSGLYRPQNKYWFITVHFKTAF